MDNGRAVGWDVAHQVANGHARAADTGQRRRQPSRLHSERTVIGFLREGSGEGRWETTVTEVSRDSGSDKLEVCGVPAVEQTPARLRIISHSASLSHRHTLADTVLNLLYVSVSSIQTPHCHTQ